jgi:hypothetical protein
MSKALQALSALLGIAVAVPALAQSRYYEPPRRSANDNAFRLEIGGASLSSPGLYCPNGARGPCYDTSPFAWQALVIAGELDLAIGGGPLNVTFGARELAAPYYSGNPSIFEPSIGLTYRFLRRSQVQPRLGVGLGLLVGNDGNAGGSVRLDGGLSLFGHAPLGLAIDLILEVGAFGGYEISQVQLAIGPEFRF